MKSLVYLRVSTKEQAEEGYSIGAQQEACTRYVRDKGWDLVDLYVDRGESARTTDRPQFQLMLKRITEDRSIRYLVVHKLDRLARNIKDYATVREMLDKLGVQLVSVTEGLEATPSGKMVEGMLAVVAEWYSNNLSTEIRKGQVQSSAKADGPPMLRSATRTCGSTRPPDSDAGAQRSCRTPKHPSCAKHSSSMRVACRSPHSPMRCSAAGSATARVAA